MQRIAASIPGALFGSSLARLEGRHRLGGNALRAAVLGANDGLVSNLSLLMGAASAADSGRTILLVRLAGLVAGACSMAIGQWLSVTSSRELNQRQIDIEAEELRAPGIMIYANRGHGIDEEKGTNFHLHSTLAGSLAESLS